MSRDHEPLGMWDDECAAPWAYAALYALVSMLTIAASMLLPWGWAVPL